MTRSIFAETREPSWNVYSIFFIAMFFILGLFSWNVLPRFTDIYYHLLVMLGFQEAGGLVLRDFLQYAPVGRQHLYPPLFHGILLGLFKVGLDPIFIARLAKVIVFPALLGAIWFVIRSVFGNRQAFFTVLIATSSYSFYSSCSDLIPGTLACILGLFSFWAQEKDRSITAGFLLGLAFYTHMLMAWILFISIAIYCVLCAFAQRNPLRRKYVLTVTLTSFFLGLPMGAYQFFNRRYFTFIPPPSFATIQVSIFVFVFALAGLTIALKRKGPAYFPVALVAALSLLQISYFSRYLSGHGLLGFVLLAASALEYLYQKIMRPDSGHWRRLLFILAAFLFFSILNPTVSFMRAMKNTRFNFFDSSIMNLLAYQAKADEGETTVYQPRFIAPFQKAIAGNSASGDIIYSNVNHLGCYLSVVTRRPTANALLPEVKPYALFDPVGAARLIIWFKNVTPGQPGEPNELISRYGLSKIKETELCYIYLNAASTAKKSIPPAFIPTPVLFAMMLGAFSVPLLAKKY